MTRNADWRYKVFLHLNSFTGMIKRWNVYKSASPKVKKEISELQDISYANQKILYKRRKGLGQKDL